MAKTCIIYGSTTGNTELAAEKIAKLIDGAETFSVADFDFSTVADYDMIIVGSSTWGMGDIQDDWETAIDDFSGADLAGKKVAIFGCGDQMSYSDSFVDAIGDLYEAAKSANAEVVGFTSTDGYDYSSSKGEVDGKFAGLALDFDNDGDNIDSKIEEWAKAL